MERAVKILTGLTVVLSLFAFSTNSFALSDKQIKKQIIQKSINSYYGKCPCPYHSDSRGHSCGRRSAYSRAGGASVLCYPSDVSVEMVEQYKKQKSNQKKLKK